MKRTPLRRRPRRSVGEINSKLWNDGMERRCILAGAPDHECEGPVDPHHVIPRSRLRREGLGTHEWDRRNRAPACRKAHEEHHTRKRPLPRAVLPGCAIEFAFEHDLLGYIERVYPTTEEAR